jgi:RNA polymerase sigma-70 factor (ECF subfamily)
LARLDGGDRGVLERLIQLYHNYLRKLIDLRLDADLRTRIDPSDVLQETHLVVIQRIGDFLERRPASFRVWLRSTALERLVDLRRHHLAKKRSVRREINISDASSLALARRVPTSRPSQVVQRKELAERIRGIILSMETMDREILLLRHVEELSNAEAAEVLAVEPAAARKRLGRALFRLTKLLSDDGIELEG